MRDAQKLKYLLFVRYRGRFVRQGGRLIYHFSGRSQNIAGLGTALDNMQIDNTIDEAEWEDDIITE